MSIEKRDFVPAFANEGSRWSIASEVVREVKQDEDG
jgi:hypothetical protein